MGDLADSVRVHETGKPPGVRKLPRRPAFADLDIYLPEVLWSGDGAPRPLDYDADVLARLDFRRIDMAPLVERIPLDGSHAEASRRVRVTVAEDGSTVSDVPVVAGGQALFDPVYATRTIPDLVPNAFAAHAMVSDLLEGLRKKGADAAMLGGLSGFLLKEVRTYLAGAVDALAEDHFKARLLAGDVQFRLRTDGRNWKMPKAIETAHAANARQLSRSDGAGIQQSLFSPVYEDDFNAQEAEFAGYLDMNAAVAWWHRNVARSDFGVQGWRRHRVYPDFLFGRGTGAAGRELFALETKGDQLAGNLDTAYKTKLLDAVTGAYRREQIQNAGRLEIVVPDGTVVTCKLVLMSDWPTVVPGMLAAAPKAIQKNKRVTSTNSGSRNTAAQAQ